MSAAGRSWNALIRTHHITSRKKVSKLRQAAANDNVYALLRSGGAPGIMYVEGLKDGVESWVASAQRLRYKDFQLVARPAEVVRESDAKKTPLPNGVLEEIDSVKDMAIRMETTGVLHWWRKSMGYSGNEDRM
ncbi:uncharacterized protein MYCFIDRAFT_86681 [Pseudocercospora fijiensis CIRAD86]|uniref:Uncharacterized protein n=1 Tax=Pseudocercospora fijiensis (strain CIRAD86) TaxID=383855 RepID=M2YWC5_PSEFD|nr:uncharacterized protein MYCFIDRAFT_86681 [Pseudocercospora fijiensis CIRAD86]EME82030.1 hypothetical protein MYCFIDRAFT_86681 [Pseudocercospora fijiensis CIRAD86]